MASSISSPEHKTVEDFYRIPFYRQLLDNFTPEQFSSYGSRCMEEAVSNGNILAMNFWASFYIPFPTSKKPYSEVILKRHKHTDFFDSLSFLVKNINIDIGDHVMLRSAIRHKHEDTIGFLAEHYPITELPTLLPFFKDKKDGHERSTSENSEGYLKIINMIAYNDLDEKLQNKESTIKKNKI